jgi:hypothetical protein
VDAGLDVAEASARIAALIAAESHGHHRQQAPIALPGRQRQRTATADPYLDQQADQAVAAAERATDDWHRPTERLRTPEEIMRSERARTPEEIMRSERLRTPEEIMRSERLRSPAEIMRSERLRSPAEIRAEEEGRSVDHDQDASRARQRELDHGRRRERSRDPWSFGR